MLTKKVRGLNDVKGAREGAVPSHLVEKVENAAERKGAPAKPVVKQYPYVHETTSNDALPFISQHEVRTASSMWNKESTTNAGLSSTTSFTIVQSSSPNILEESRLLDIKVIENKIILY